MRKMRLLGLVCVFAMGFTARADISYNVSRTVGAGTVTGFIETDGTAGILNTSNILDWNLVVTSGGQTLNLTGPLSGNSSNVLGSSLGNDLTATPSNLLFNFGSADAGYLLFQTNGLFGSGAQYYCDAATNQNFVCAAGEDLVPVSAFDPSYDPSGPLQGNQIIGSVAGGTVTPEPGYWALLSVAVAGLIWLKRRRVKAIESK
jgi:hypothetical protein